MNKVNKNFLVDSLLWGVVLWLIGYVLGIVLFMFVPANLLGWVIMPIGILIALWVLLKKVKGVGLQYYLGVAVIWALIAVVFDYVFLVLLFKPTDGYYKLDVYLYYAITILLPLIVGLIKTKKTKKGKK